MSEEARRSRAGRIGRVVAWVAASAAGVATATLLFGKAAPPATHRFDEASGRGAPAEPASETAVGQGHETRDMSGRLMMWLMLGLGGSVGVMIGLTMLLLDGFQQQRIDQPTRLTAEQTAPLHPPKPNLQADPVTDLAQLHAREDALLHGYGWIDGEHGRARIPIKRAMALTVGHSLDPMP